MPRAPKLDDPMPGMPADRNGHVPTRAEHIIFLVRTGAYLETAAEAAGIHKSTLYRWLDTDRPRFRDFRDSLTRARAEAEVNALLTIQAAARGGQKRKKSRTVKVGDKPIRVQEDEEEAGPDWTAAAWFLERTAPTRYGRREAIEVTGKDGGAIEVRDAEASRLAGAWERFKVEQGVEVRQLEPPPAPALDDVVGDDVVDAELVDEGED